ncbi:alpha/beta fold hydrolase [Agrobacterium sp. B1(2019)]|nr:alpha/beta fold hydrolase [Agrobacterium sp. B1(2019)]
MVMLGASNIRRATMRWIGIPSLLLALVTSGCAGHSENVLIPSADGGGTPVDILVMSTREKSPTPGQIYGGERARDWSLSRVVVSVPPSKARKIGKVQWPRRYPPNAATEFATLSAASVSGAQVDDWFLSVAGRRRKVLIFVHGFNNSFAEALYRLAQVKTDSGTDAAPILFTWPSRGGPFAYLYDKESATYSRNALEYLIDRAAKDRNVTDITILAHSMGNWLALEALRQLAIRRGHLPEKVRNVIMASPDVDVDVFRLEYEQFRGPKPKVTLFLSKDDSALSISRFLSGEKDRLGSIDPDVEPYRSKLQNADLSVVDLTKVSSGDRFHHGKFAESPEIVRLIGKRLIEGQDISGTDLVTGMRLPILMDR